MAFRDVPGIGWTIIIILAMLMGWGILKHATGMPGFPDDLRKAILHLIGTSDEPGPKIPDHGAGERQVPPGNPGEPKP